MVQDIAGASRFDWRADGNQTANLGRLSLSVQKQRARCSLRPDLLSGTILDKLLAQNPAVA